MAHFIEMSWWHASKDCSANRTIDSQTKLIRHFAHGGKQYGPDAPEPRHLSDAVDLARARSTPRQSRQGRTGSVPGL